MELGGADAAVPNASVELLRAAFDDDGVPPVDDFVAEEAAEGEAFEDVGSMIERAMTVQLIMIARPLLKIAASFFLPLGKSPKPYIQDSPSLLLRSPKVRG